MHSNEVKNKKTKSEQIGTANFSGSKTYCFEKISLGCISCFIWSGLIPPPDTLLRVRPKNSDETFYYSCSINLFLDWFLLLARCGRKSSAQDLYVGGEGMVMVWRIPRHS
jgi:hypothetical protein